MYRGLIVLILCHFSVDLFTGIWPLYKKIADIDLVVAGAIAMIGGMAGNLAQLYFGQIADKGSRRKYLFLGLFLSSGASLYPYVTSNYLLGVLLFATFIGSSAFHPAATGLAGRLTENKKGAMISLFVCGGSLGLAMSQITFGEIYHNYQKQTAYLMLLPLFCAGIAYIFLPASFSNSKPDASIAKFFDSLKGVFSKLKLLYLIQVLNVSLNVGVIFLIPEIMSEMGMGEVLENGGGHFFFIIGSVLLISFSGHIADRLGHKKTILLSHILVLPIYYLFFNAGALSFEWKLLLFVIMGGLLGVCGPISIAIGSHILPKQASLVSALLMGAAWGVGNLCYLGISLCAKYLGTIPSLNALGILILINIALICKFKDKVVSTS